VAQIKSILEKLVPTREKNKKKTWNLKGAKLILQKPTSL
jgi:hypothetical protein